MLRPRLPNSPRRRRPAAAAEAQRKAEEEAQRKANRITYSVTTTGSGVRGDGHVVSENSSSGEYAVVSCG
ncbi:hypothetical protein [Amycolatopsis sp. NPDC049159]|uniref:hypothetical protein n=1 Tax=Amycolatopsis sp. NPDC049159 TaxID=3157210 RepID=UPI0033F2B2D2